MSTLPVSAQSRVAEDLERAAASVTKVYGRSGDPVLDDLVYDDFFATAAHLGQPVFTPPPRRQATHPL